MTQGQTDGDESKGHTNEKNTGGRQTGMSTRDIQTGMSTRGIHGDVNTGGIGIRLCLQCIQRREASKRRVRNRRDGVVGQVATRESVAEWNIHVRGQRQKREHIAWHARQPIAVQ